jgi:hypothetical protein
MVKTITIQKADCVDNETFEAIVESAGLSCFEPDGEPKDVECLNITGSINNDNYERSISLNKNDMDETTWSEIIETFQLLHSTEDISIRFEEVSLV